MPRSRTAGRCVEWVDGEVVLSRVPYGPGPTHTPLDVLAAAANLRSPRSVGVLGLAAGGVVAPLRALGLAGPVEGADREPEGEAVLRRALGERAGEVRFVAGEATAWLREAAPRHEAWIEDLSVPDGGRPVK